MVGSTSRQLIVMATAGLMIASPVQAQGLFGKLGELVDKVERKVDETDQRVQQGERTTQTAGSIIDRLGIKKRSKTGDDQVMPQPEDPVEKKGFIRRQMGRDVDPDAGGTVGPVMPEPRDPAQMDPAQMSDAAFPHNLPVYPGAWQVETTDPRVPVVFYTPASGNEVVAFYTAEGKRHGFQAFPSANPYPGLVLLNAQEEGAVVATVPDGKGTRFFVNDGSAFASD